jgi:SAM-dependent methyltransferase
MSTDPWLGARRVPLYDALAGDYDRFVNWEGRLSHELPFFVHLFQEHAVRRVLDAACGTGQHAIALAHQGYQVVGTDLSAAMVLRAKANAASEAVDSEVLRFEVAAFGELATLGQDFDAVLCLGNSLPHLLTDGALAEALADFATVLRPGGLLVIQNRNFDRVWRDRERFMEPQAYREGDDEQIFLRFYDFGEETITFNMIRLQRTAGGWVQDVESTELRPIFRDHLDAALAEAGFRDTNFYGGYDVSDFADGSGDLVAVAVRR